MKVPERSYLTRSGEGSQKKEYHKDKMNVRTIEVKECESEELLYCVRVYYMYMCARARVCVCVCVCVHSAMYTYTRKYI